MDDLKQSEWEESYSKGQNYMYYPKEQTVRFLNWFATLNKGKL